MKNNNLNYICGSRLGTDPIELANNIATLATYTHELIHDKTVSAPAKHNVYTSYCLKMLAYSTAHRPVIDMFAFREDIDLEENIVVINDKISSSTCENRVCWFSELANTQLRAYFKHLQSLASLLHIEHNKVDLARTIYGLTDPVPAHRQSLPLFFYLSENLKTLSITPSLLSEKIINVWPYTPLCQDSCRL